MKGLICIIAFIICVAIAYSVQDSAVSAIHEIYSALWGIMAVMFICTLFVIDTLNHPKKQSTTEQKEK